MRLFINYAPSDQEHCHRVAEILRIHEVWFEGQVLPGQERQQEIARRIDWAEGMIFLISPESIASGHCRRVYQVIRRAGKSIFPVLVRPDTTIPQELAQLQPVDFSQGIRPESVQRLLSGIHLAEKALKSSQAKSRLSADQMVQQVADGMQALQIGAYGRAVTALRAALASGFESQFIDLRQTLQNAERAYRQQKERAQRDYQLIVALMQRDATRTLGCHLFMAYREQFPDYDPANMAAIYEQVKVSRQILPAIPEAVVLTGTASSDGRQDSPERSAVGS